MRVGRKKKMTERSRHTNSRHPVFNQTMEFIVDADTAKVGPGRKVGVGCRGGGAGAQGLTLAEVLPRRLRVPELVASLATMAASVVVSHPRRATAPHCPSQDTGALITLQVLDRSWLFPTDFKVSAAASTCDCLRLLGGKHAGGIRCSVATQR